MRAPSGQLTPSGPGRYSSRSTEGSDRLDKRSSQRESLLSLPTQSHGSLFFRRQNSVSQASLAIDDQSDFSTVPLTPPSPMALRQRQSRNQSSSAVSQVSHPGWGSAPQSIAWSLPSASKLHHPPASLQSRSRFVMSSPSTGSSVHEGW
jgi:hypothetical protein